MRKSALAVVAFLCLDVVLSAQVANDAQGEQATQTQKAGPPFANADVICMVQAGLDESTIVLAIEQKPTAAFDTSPDARTELKKAGVSQAIMNAMRRKGALPSVESGRTSQERERAVSKQSTVQVGTFNVGKFPIGVAFDGTNVWVANSVSNNVTKLRASDGSVLGAFVGEFPIGVAFDGTNIWVANGEGNNVTKLRPTDGTVLGTFKVGTKPAFVAFDGANIWVTNEDSNNVTKLRASDGAVLGTFNVGKNPVGVVFDGTNIWVTSRDSNTVTKLRTAMEPCSELSP